MQTCCPNNIYVVLIKRRKRKRTDKLIGSHDYCRLGGSLACHFFFQFSIIYFLGDVKTGRFFAQLGQVPVAATATREPTPSATVGVAGLARSSTSFPIPLANTQKVTSFHALPPERWQDRGNSMGAAIFCGCLFLLVPLADLPSQCWPV